jgi:hypothetical protein
VNNKFRTVLAVLIEPENVIMIIGTVVAAILGYSGIKDNDVQQALTAILTVLGTLAVAQIIAGYESSKARKTAERVENLLQRFAFSTNPPLRRRTGLTSLQERARSAQDVLIIGRTAGIVLRQTDFFQDRIRQGATVRLAVINPDNDVVIEALTPLAETSKEGLAADLQVVRELVHRIKEQTSNSEQLQVRVFDYVPTLSLVMVDGHLPTGHIVVEMVPYQVGPSLRPHLFLTAEDNPSWYAYFRDVCETIWRDAKALPSYFD